MAKAKIPKPTILSAARVHETYAKITAELNTKVTALEEAICPKVASRLSGLERMQAKLISMQAVDRQNIHILDREHESLGEVVNDNADKCEKLAARVVSLEAARRSTHANATTDTIFNRLEALESRTDSLNNYLEKTNFPTPESLMARVNALERDNGDDAKDLFQIRRRLEVLEKARLVGDIKRDAQPFIDSRDGFWKQPAPIERGPEPISVLDEKMVEHIMWISAGLSRSARHELIVKLTDKNRGT